MLRFAKPGTVRALLMAAAVALAVPVAGGLALTAEGKRARALNRPLEGLPALAEATGDPAGALRRLGDYAGDRALGVVGAGTALARLR